MLVLVLVLVVVLVYDCEVPSAVVPVFVAAPAPPRVCSMLHTTHADVRARVFYDLYLVSYETCFMFYMREFYELCMTLIRATYAHPDTGDRYASPLSPSYNTLVCACLYLYAQCTVHRYTFHIDADIYQPSSRVLSLSSSPGELRISCFNS